MCGIAGASFDPGFQIDAAIKDIAAQMLLDIEHRGTHATGIAWYRPDQKVRFRKDPIRARKFVKSILPNLDVGPTFIAHTRFATQGSPRERRNNHPFLCDRIVGIHNGVIHNDEALTARFKLRRTSETDSEVIFRLLERFGPDSHSTLEEIGGSFAIAYLVADDGALYIARGSGSMETLHHQPRRVFVLLLSGHGLGSRRASRDALSTDLGGKARVLGESGEGTVDGRAILHSTSRMVGAAFPPHDGSGVGS